ncbi:MAG: hypothetical protein PVI80_15025 [Anaerolineae bacterium]
MMGRGDRMEAPNVYEICVEGRLGPEWSAWFDGLTITNQPTGQTVLRGAVPDQAALHGILIKIRNLGLPLLSVRQVKDDR